MDLWWVDFDSKAQIAFRTKIYNSKRWKDTRAYVLSLNPFCAECAENNRVTPANQVDHKKTLGEIYLSGDYDDAYDIDNLQSLCAPCHGAKSAKDRNINKTK